VGDKRAAEEFEVKPATIRSWRRRVAGEPVAASPVDMPVVESPSTAAAAEGENGAVSSAGVSGLAAMRHDAEELAVLAGEATAKSREQLQAGLASDSRSSATVFGIAHDKLLQVRKAIAAAESEEREAAARLGRETLELQASLLRAVFVALDIPVPVETMRVLATRAAAGEELAVPDEIAAADREEVRARVRGELLEELAAEGVMPGDDGRGAGEAEGEEQVGEGERDGEREAGVAPALAIREAKHSAENDGTSSARGSEGEDIPISALDQDLKKRLDKASAKYEQARRNEAGEIRIRQGNPRPAARRSRYGEHSHSALRGR
jgi:hypothetical protein